MFRFAHARNLVLPLIVIIAMIGVVVGVIRSKPKPPPRVAPAPIDTGVPEGLSTATFGMG